MKALVCARCVAPIQGEQFKIGPYTYGDCCIEKVKTKEKP